MKSPSAPAAPDPAATAKAATEQNIKTAVAQYGLNATNQVTPQGKLTYSQVGQWADGTPRFQSETTYSPGEQAIYDQDTATRQKMGTIAGAQTDRIGELLGSPVNLNNEATEARLMELGRKRLDPMFADKSAALEQDLMNRGIRPGGDAYAAKRDELGRQENDAYNELLLKGRGQAVNEALTERNQPINETTALMSNSQVSQPQFGSTPTPGVAPVDYAGLVNNNYNAQLQQWQQKQANQNAMMGAIGGAAGTALGGWATGGFKRAA